MDNPSIDLRGLPGNRLEAIRAGIIATIDTENHSKQLASGN